MEEGDRFRNPTDQGGPSREFWVLFMGKMANSKIFTQEEKGHLRLLPCCAWKIKPEDYECSGLFLGLLIKNSQQAPFPLHKYFFSKLLHSDAPSPTEDDLADVMPQVGKSMKNLTVDNIEDIDVFSGT